jgi:hypothetical protein
LRSKFLLFKQFLNMIIHKQLIKREKYKKENLLLGYWSRIRLTPVPPHLPRIHQNQKKIQFMHLWV